MSCGTPNATEDPVLSCFKWRTLCVVSPYSGTPMQLHWGLSLPDSCSASRIRPAIREKRILNRLGGGFVLLTWKVVLSVPWVGELDRTASTTGPRVGLWKRVPGMAKVVMLVEGFVILFLSSWLYEEYVSNPFMQSYVNDFIRSDVGSTAILGTLVTIIAFTITGMVYRTRSAGKLERVSAGIKPASPSPMVTPTLTKGVGPEQTGPLHPVVAALKAEISGTSTSAGGVSGLAPQSFGLPAGVPTETDSSPVVVRMLEVTGTRPTHKKSETESQTGDKTPVSA